jgi:hypothetical protein
VDLDSTPHYANKKKKTISTEWMEPAFLQKQWLTQYMAEEDGVERGTVRLEQAKGTQSISQLEAQVTLI